MPVVRTRDKPLQEGNRPDWCTATGAGIFRVPAAGGRFDEHFHDCDEYWLINRGKAKIRSENREYYVMPGDIVCTRAGDEHDVVDVYEDLEGFWFEGATPAGGRTGHLYRSPEKARGHAVIHRPVPDDFPLPVPGDHRR